MMHLVVPEHKGGSGGGEDKHSGQVTTTTTSSMAADDEVSSAVRVVPAFPDDSPQPPAAEDEEEEPSATLWNGVGSAERLSEQEEVLSFKTDMADNWAAAARRVDRGRLLAEALLASLKDRASLEDAYAEGMRRAAARIGTVPVTEGSTVTEAVTIIHKALLHRAHVAQEMAESIRQEIVSTTLGATVSNHMKVFKQINFDGTNVARDVRVRQQEFLKSRSHYWDACDKAKRLIAEYQATERAPSGSHRSKLAATTLDQIVEAQSALQKYSAAAEICNAICDLSSSQTELMLSALEEMDKKRVQCLKDALRKLLVFEVSSLRQNEYEVNQLMQGVEAVDAAADLQEFIRHQSALPPGVNPAPPMTRPAEVKRWPLDEEDRPLQTEARASKAATGAGDSAAQNKGTQRLSSAIQEVFSNVDTLLGQIAGEEKSTASHRRRGQSRGAESAESSSQNPQQPERMIASETSVNVVRQEWSGLLDGLFNGDLEVLRTHPASKLKDDMASSLYRYALVKELQARYDADQVNMSNFFCFRGLGKLCEWLLDWADRQFDFWSARWVMCFAPYFKCRGSVGQDPQAIRFSWPKNESGFQKLLGKYEDFLSAESLRNDDSTSIVWSLHRCIYHHKLWNRVQFWEDSLMYTISEFLQKRFMQQAWAKLPAEEQSKEQAQFNVCCPLVGHMRTFAKTMVSYGILEQQVTHLIVKICAQHSVGDEIAKELMACLQEETNTDDNHAENSMNRMEDERTAKNIKDVDLAQSECEVVETLAESEGQL